MRQFNLHDFPQLTFKAADWDLMQQGEQLLIKQNEQWKIKRLKSITEFWAEWKAEFDRKYWGSWSLRSPPAQWSKCSIMFLCICSSLNVASPPVSTFQNCASQLVASKPNLFIWKAVNLPLFRGCFQTCFLIMSVSVRLLSGELLSHSFVCVLFTEIGGMSRVSLSHAASISWFSSSPIFFFFIPIKNPYRIKKGLLLSVHVLWPFVGPTLIRLSDFGSLSEKTVETTSFSCMCETIRAYLSTEH